MIAPRFGHAAVLLTDGRVLIAGGYGELFPNLQAEMITEPSLVAVPDGAAILFGGSCEPSVARFDPTTLLFTTVGPGAQSQTLHSPPVVTASGRVVLAGGGILQRTRRLHHFGRVRNR